MVATDVSLSQVRQAAPHLRISYWVARSEDSGLATASVDLVTVAAAVHWFDLGLFFAEVERVARPGCVLAIWSYHVGDVAPPLDEIFAGFYDEVLKPFFASGARLVDDRYQTIDLPGHELSGEELEMTASWTLDQMIAYIMTWSGVHQYIAEHGRNPVESIRGELERAWGAPETVQTVRWPLYLRLTRL